MKRTAKYLFLTLLITGCQLLVHTKSSHAQSNTKAFRHFTPQDGFPTYIIDLDQDNKGQIWTTGPSGLSRFDGYDLKSYLHDPNDEFSVPEGLNYYLLVDNKGLIWLSGQYGVSYYDPAFEQFHTITLPDSLPAKGLITSFIQTKDDYIWTTSVNGLYRYKPPSEEQPQPEVRFFSNGLDEANRIAYFDLLEGPDGLIWLRSSRGVYHFNSETNTFSSAINQEDIPNGLDVTTWAVGDMAISPDNAVWIAFQGGILVFKPGNPDPELITTLGDDAFDLSDVRIGTMIFARDGTLWIGTETHGALHFDPLTNELIQYNTETNDTDGIFENPVTTIFEDSDGNIWFGFENNGMSVTYDKTWSYAYKKIDEMLDATHPTNSILHLVSDQNSNVWAATSYGLAFIPEDGGPSKVFLPSPKTPATSRIRNENWIAGISLSDTTIYALGVGRESSFVYIFDINDEQFTTVPIPDSLRIVQRFAATESTLYWRAFGIYQLVALNKNDLSIKTIELPFAYPTSNTAAASDTQKVVNPMVSHSGDLYIQVMSLTGRSRHSEKWDYYKYEPEQDTFSKIVMTPISDVRLSFDRSTKFSSSTDSNIVWSVADRGILVENLDSGSRRFTQLGFNPNEVRRGGDMMDEDGFIWMSEARPLINKIDLAGSNVNSYPLDRGRQVSMYRSVQLPNGTIMFGGDGGYIQFDPDEVREVSNIQKLFITEFMAGTNDIVNVSSDETYDIEYASNNISFSYLGINYRSPNNRYRYRLLGYSDDWTDVDMQRTISFANLPIGAYTFEVQAVTPGSSFSDESATATVNFVILPPWWRTTMAYFSYAVLIGGFVFSADRFQRKRLIQKERDRATAKELEQAKEIEKAYQNLELAHGNLISAQEQLIQQEKLASLGQLTAGIAHEIKNPLNFVNNFSNVSLEMIDEALDEIHQIGQNKHATETAAILSDIKLNLSKIVEHGSRADGIVKSMLQHSRGGSGKMEPTDLNALVSEFVNLSYHGMRAGKDPIDAEITLDLDGSIGEIPLVYEDFSRVILNICTNAFDAMRGAVIGYQLSVIGNPSSVINDQGSMIGDLGNDGAYLPHLKVRTKRDANRVAIEIEDNGPGIPDEIKDKILQPFFTTKKGTQGTGLGLSITHDIVKVHGGDIQIVSELGKGATFIITLAIQTTQ